MERGVPSGHVGSYAYWSKAALRDRERGKNHLADHGHGLNDREPGRGTPPERSSSCTSSFSIFPWVLPCHGSGFTLALALPAPF